MKKLLILGIVVVMVSSAVTGCNSSQKTNDQQTSIEQTTNDKASGSENYVATVGEYGITEGEFKYFLASTKLFMEQQAGVYDEESRKQFWEGKVEDVPAKELAKQITLNSIKEFKVLLSKAKEAGTKLDDSEIEATNQQLETFIQMLGDGETGKQEFERMYGVSVDEVYKINPDIALVQKFNHEKMHELEPTEEEARKFYEDNIEYYELVTVRHILFLTTDAETGEPLPQDKQDEAKKKAEDILARINAGEDMAELAKEYSEDPGSKDNGGEYTFGKGEMVEEFENWAFNAKVGDTGIVKTEYGYHVMKLEKILGYDDVKDLVREELRAKKFTELVEEWKSDPKYRLIENWDLIDKIEV
ncbi:MAG: hypothetical protein GX066_08205 [Clostridiaceae bacterium]|nr:hypothetical protein [Clostridiaceae bacterium]